MAGGDHVGVVELRVRTQDADPGERARPRSPSLGDETLSATSIGSLPRRSLTAAMTGRETGVQIVASSGCRVGTP